MLPRLFGVFACLMGLIFVGLSALVSHVWKLDAVGSQRMDIALRILVVHALALLIVRLPSKSHEFSARLAPLQGMIGIGFTLGTMLFSGGLIAASLTGASTWTRVAPIGGSMLMLSWLLWALWFWKSAR